MTSWKILLFGGMGRYDILKENQKGKKKLEKPTFLFYLHHNCKRTTKQWINTGNVAGYTCSLPIIYFPAENVIAFQSVDHLTFSSNSLLDKVTLKESILFKLSQVLLFTFWWLFSYHNIDPHKAYNLVFFKTFEVLKWSHPGIFPSSHAQQQTHPIPLFHLLLQTTKLLFFLYVKLRIPDI